MSEGILTTYPAFSYSVESESVRQIHRNLGWTRIKYSYKGFGMSWEETSKSVKEKAVFMSYLPALKSENCNIYGLKNKYRQISSFALPGMSSVTVEERLSI